jgi:CheY-like chemotaxis protein
MTLKGEYILIGEDNPLNRVVYQIILGGQKAEIVFDRWGREALARLRSINHCDLIIFDLMLTYSVSGFDIFKQIRSFPKFDSIPIVAVSASDPGEAMPKTRELGFSGYISKPIDEALFPNQIEKIMNGDPVWFDGRSLVD